MKKTRWEQLKKSLEAPPAGESTVLRELRRNAMRWTAQMLMQQLARVLFEWVEAEPGRKVEIVNEGEATGIHFYQDGQPADGPWPAEAKGELP